MSSGSAVSAVLIAAAVLICFAVFMVSFVFVPLLLVLVFYVCIRINERARER